jgi:hypothetical protein
MTGQTRSDFSTKFLQKGAIIEACNLCVTSLYSMNVKDTRNFLW